MGCFILLTNFLDISFLPSVSFHIKMLFPFTCMLNLHNLLFFASGRKRSLHRAVIWHGVCVEVPM